MRFPFITLIAAILVCQAPARAEVGKKYAVLIGVKRYDNVNFTNLNYTENDVVALAEILRPQGFDVTLLSDSQSGESQPTRANILKHLDRVTRRLQREDTLVFGFAGHGLQFEGETDSYFLPRDAQPGDSKTLVSLQDVYDKLENCGAGVKLMFVDACRTHEKKVRGRSAFDDRTPSPPNGVCALFSCSAGEAAYEDNELRHGVFFYHLLEGLRGKAKDLDNDVTVLGLAHYAMRSVKKSGHSQTPVLKGEVTDGVLIRLASLVSPGTPAIPPTKSMTTSIKPTTKPSTKPVEKVVPEPVKGPPKAGDEGVNTLGMRLIYVPAGTFTMGSPKSEQARYQRVSESNYASQEKQHQVTLTRSFYIGKYTVTQEEYESIMGTNPSWFSAGGKGRAAVAQFKDTRRLPVDSVTWHEAQEFCRRLSIKDGRKYRLPTEAEWEYACRAGTKTAFWTGENLTTDQANHDGDVAFTGGHEGINREKPLAVGSFAPNPWGLYDMHGNMAQWCWDWYSETEYFDRGNCTNPTGPAEGSSKITRGGSWSSNASWCRSANRAVVEPGERSNTIGFRILLEIRP